MLAFQYPWMFILLLLPMLVRFLLPAYREPRPAIRVPWFNRTSAVLGIEPTDGAVIHTLGIFSLIFKGILWLLIISALARPQYIEDPVVRQLPTRDVMLIVDLSGSMETVDFTNADGKSVDRLTAVKEVLDEFLTRRQGDRVGLIVFGNAPFVQVPFTQDLEACRLLLNETAPRMAGPKTAFGDAIGLGITMFERSEVSDRVMIALTDGNDTGSRIPPAEAAKIAADNDITIHVVGVGDPTAAGEELLDEEALKTVASVTGGNYYFASDRDKLSGIYDELDKLGTRDVETESYRPRIDLFHWPLGTFIALSFLYCVVVLVGWIRDDRMTEQAGHD